jgi:hypothetical protein
MHHGAHRKEGAMSDKLDLEPIKARLAATTAGDWKWLDEFGRDIPYDNETWPGEKEIPTGNDGSLGVEGLYIEQVVDEDSSDFEPVLYADDDNIPDDPNDPNDVDWSKWRGLIRVTNTADLEFIAQAKPDIAALIAEIERLRGQGSA